MIDVFSYKLGMSRGGGGGGASNVDSILYYRRGETTAIETVKPMDGMVAYKISNTAPTVEELMGCHVEYQHSTGYISETVGNTSFSYADENYAIGIFFICAYKDSVVQGIPVSTGFWVLEMGGEYLIELKKKGEINVLPTVTNADNGDVLMVVDGEWEEVEIKNGNEVAY